jgi:hypothetical protein
MKLWKVQKFFGDVVYDLRQRGLLPVAIALLVAMVAIPLVISRGGGSDAPPPSNGADLEQAAELAPENQKAVVSYSPGLRNYKNRLEDLASKDPFAQQYAQAAAAASQLNTSLSGSGAGAGGGATPSESTGDVSTTDTGGGTDTDTGKSTKPKSRYYYYTTDLLVGEAAWTLQRRNGVPALTTLPSDIVPVIVYLGATIDGKRALFMVSDDVTQVSGQGQCLPSPTDCSLLALRRDQTEDLLYGLDGKIYRVKVLRNRRIVSSKPPQG